VPGKDLQGVIAYRDIADTNAMIDAAKKYKHAVVIGGGLLGLEAANGLKLRGMDVTVVHVMPWLMERQLDDESPAACCSKSLEERGLKFLMGAQTQELVGGANGRVRRCVQGRHRSPGRPGRDGRRHPPQHRSWPKSGLLVNRGIVVHDTLQTVTDARIYSVGECAAHRGIAYGLVAPLFEQAKVAANHLAQFGIGRYTGSLTSTKLKVTGIDLFSAGEFMGGEGTEEIVMSDPFGGVYKKLVIKDDKLVGACLYGDTVDGSWYFKLLRDGRSVGDIRDKLMFGESNLGDTGHQGQTGGRHARQRRGLRLQRRQQGHHLQGHQGQGPVHAGRGAQAHQGQRLAAARAPAWSSRSSCSPPAATTRRRPRRRPCAAAPTTATRTCATPSAPTSC
jgi:nitrite reductase (NADH) large subunit